MQKWPPIRRTGYHCPDIMTPKTFIENTEMEATRVFVFNKFASILFLIGTVFLAIETKSFEISEICQKDICLRIDLKASSPTERRVA